MENEAERGRMAIEGKEPCFYCVHNPVCVYTEKIKKIRWKIDELECLHDNDLIEPIELRCRFYMSGKLRKN